MNDLLTELPPTLQRLVDARLDSIERALLSTDSSRAERRQILAAVEDQIQEQLSRLGHEPSRDEVLQLLASLDPPEAYGWRTIESSGDETTILPLERQQPFQQNSGIRKTNVLAIISGCMAVMSLSALTTVNLLDLISFIASLALSLPAFILGIVALRQIAFDGTQTGKPLATLGIISLPVSFFLMCMIYLMLGS